MDYEYDANGNLIEIRIAGTVAWTYTYDTANRLIHTEDSTGAIVADYYYDPFGRRLWKEVNGTRTYFFYSDEGLIAEYDEDGNEIRSYGYQPDSTWTTDPLWLQQDGQYYWYQNDHLGTPQKLVDMAGTVVWSAQYAAFGKATIEVEDVTNHLRFPGQYFDAETGLHYNFQRYYDPGSGRYVSADPIGFEGEEVNLYQYVGSNPIRLIDPYGLSFWEVWSHFVVNYTPGQLTSKKFWEFWSSSQRQEWFAEFYQQFGDAIHQAATNYCIPEELLFVVIVNEQIDHSLYEELGEWLGLGASVGPAQITVATVRRDDSYVSPLIPDDQILREGLRDEYYSMFIAASLMKNYLDTFCHAVKDKKFSSSFAFDVAKGCTFQDICCREVTEQCSDVVNMDVPICLMRAMVGIWNDGPGLIEQHDIPNQKPNTWNFIQWADLLDGVFESLHHSH